MTVGARLRQAREFRKLTQPEMATLLGMKHYQQLQTYERGSSLPGSEILTRLVGLGFNANWLLTGKGPMELEGR